MTITEAARLWSLGFNFIPQAFLEAAIEYNCDYDELVVPMYGSEVDILDGEYEGLTGVITECMAGGKFEIKITAGENATIELSEDEFEIYRGSLHLPENYVCWMFENQYDVEWVEDIENQRAICENGLQVFTIYASDDETHVVIVADNDSGVPISTTIEALYIERGLKWHEVKK